jgi:hypothetical protein
MRVRHKKAGGKKQEGKNRRKVVWTMECIRHNRRAAGYL